MPRRRSSHGRNEDICLHQVRADSRGRRGERHDLGVTDLSLLSTLQLDIEGFSTGRRNSEHEPQERSVSDFVSALFWFSVLYRCVLDLLISELWHGSVSVSDFGVHLGVHKYQYLMGGYGHECIVTQRL